MYAYKSTNTFILVIIATLAVILSESTISAQFSMARLHPKCRRTGPTTHLSTEWGMRLFAGAHFYIPYGSNTAIQHISELVSSGRKKIEKGNDNIKSLCTLVKIKGFKLEMEGQGGGYMIQDCSVIKKGMNDCKINARSETPEYQKNGDSIVIIVWTDNKTTMAIVRCSSDGRYNDWYTFSTLTSLNDTMKSDILSAVGKLGFANRSEDATSPPYSDCKLFTAAEVAEDE